MGFLKKLFGGGSAPSRDDGLYVYIKLARGGEIVRLRINPGSELNPNEDETGYVSRKYVVGPRSYQRAEGTFHFNANRQIVSVELEGGEVSTEEEWQAQEANNEVSN